MKHLSRRSRIAQWNTIFRWAFVLTLLFIFIGAAVASGAQASAPQAAIDIPGVDVCAKNAPFVNTPDSGLAGLVGERPLKITTDNSPEHIWSTGGFGGLRSYTYDLGCAIDPTSWVRVTNANTEAGLANWITSVSNAMTSLTDSVDRRAWQPGYVTTFLEDFATRAMGVVDASILVPMLGLGLVGATALLLYRAHDGNIGAVAGSIGWIMVVLTTTSLLILAPLILSDGATAGGGMVATTLNNGANPSDAATNQIVKNVQYQGWLRRNFGSQDTLVAKRYGPDLLASTRISWAELDTINKARPSEQPKVRKALSDKKEKAFKDIAEKVKDEDPIAYKYLTGEESTSTETLLEVLFVLATCLFRLATAILMIACTITLVLLAIIWVVATPALVLPPAGRFNGQEMGMGLVNSATRALGYVVAAVFGSWLFGIYLQACLAPGMSAWWSLGLLVLGSGIAWTVIRPDRKFLSIISLGRVNGYGYVGKMVYTAAIAYFTGRIAGRAAGEEVVESLEDEDEQARPAQVRTQPAVTATPTVHADIYTPAAPFIHEGPALPGGLPPYERETGEPVAAKPAPPPDDAESPYERPAESTTETEGADHA